MGTRDDDLSADDQAVADLLRRAAPGAGEQFVLATEQRLIGRRARERGVVRRRPLLAAVGLSGALASLAVFIGLIGVGPLATSDDAARAKDDCRSVRVTHRVRQGQVTRDRDGVLTVVDRTRPVTTTVKRCRR